jgi:hypothetical protein
MKRIGFACKWIDNADQIDGIKPNDSAKKYNTGTTTIAWLDRQSKKVAEEKIWDLMVSNITSVQKLVDKVHWIRILGWSGLVVISCQFSHILAIAIFGNKRM